MSIAHVVKGQKYYRDETGSLFSGCLDQSNMVGGTGNREAHHEFRADVIGNQSVLDYGCGRGDFVKFLRDRGIRADGYDPYSEDYNTLITGETYDVVTMIEVIEHTCDPYPELDEILCLLKPGGILFVETSFSNWVTPDHPYLNPEIGHSTIFSHAGLDALMIKKGYEVGNHVNDNVRFFRKKR